MYGDVDPDALSKEELQEMAEAEGVETSGTKAEIAERLEQVDEAKGYVRRPLEGFDPKNPGGANFGYGTVDDDAIVAREEAGQSSPLPSAEESEGGKGFGYGEVPKERKESGAY